MEECQNFIGVDIGKDIFVVAMNGQKKVREHKNTSLNIKTFLEEYSADLSNALMVLETTGGCEMLVLLALYDAHIAVQRADTRKVKNFIRSFGNRAKTDKLDAQALALYARERYESLMLLKTLSQNMLELQSLAERRRDLKRMSVTERNRRQGPSAALIQDSCNAVMFMLADQINELTKRIDEVIKVEGSLRKRQEVLHTIPGIGPTVSQD